MRKYETIAIISPELDEAAITATIDKIKDIITNNSGEVVKVDNWGTKRLAYDVKKHRSGYYTCINFNAVNETIDELNRNYRITDSVIKSIIVRLDD
ncbi:MAG: 30S ribosomal protein S6 [Halanaerobiales bacterium]|nr:30S ribosomal protein S6 [Halanaerobiales bacterium]